jgi:hypothetical protein
MAAAVPRQQGELRYGAQGRKKRSERGRKCRRRGGMGAVVAAFGHRQLGSERTPHQRDAGETGRICAMFTELRTDVPEVTGAPVDRRAPFALSPWAAEASGLAVGRLRPAAPGAPICRDRRRHAESHAAGQ